MRLLILVCSLFLASAAGANKYSVAIAPAIARDAVPSQLESAMGQAVAEMLSWELSALPNVKVTDPDDASAALPQTDRSELGEAELTDAENAQRKLSVDAFVFPRIIHEGDHVQVQAILATFVGTHSQTFRWQADGPDDQVLPLIRRSAITMADSLRISLPDSVRQLLTQTQGSSWDIVELFAKGIDAENSKRREDALAFYQEAQSRGALLPAMTVRMKKLQASLGRAVH